MSTATAADPVVRDHLDRYDDPARLTQHLRGMHRQLVTRAQENDLDALRAIHNDTHQH